jgi:hypothetical protein
MMPLMPSTRPNAAHTPRRSPSGTGGALNNIEADDQFAARSPPLNASAHQDRPIMPANLRHHLRRSPSPHLGTEPAALKSP